MEPRYIGGIAIFGERGRAPIASSLIERLSDLPPTKRRLVLAQACTLPWQDDPDKLPDCYRRELDLAEWEAEEEDRLRGNAADPLDTGPLIEDGEPPINEVFLRQLIPLGPSHRRSILTFACTGSWLERKERPPEWISRHNRHALGDQAEESRLIGGDVEA